MTHLLAIDQGTTSTRAFLFDEALQPVGFAQLEFPQIFPAPGHVEHDPQGIWTTSVATCDQCSGTSMFSRRNTIEPSGLRISLVAVRNGISA